MLSALCHLISPILLWPHVQVFEAGAVISIGESTPPTSCLMLCYDRLGIFRSNSYYYLDIQNEKTSVSDVGSAPKTSVHDVPSSASVQGLQTMPDWPPAQRGRADVLVLLLPTKLMWRGAAASEPAVYAC